MFKEAWSPAATGNPEKHLSGGKMRSHWVKQLLCSHCDSHQKGRALQGQALHVEVTHVFMMPSTIIAWFSTVWGISKCLRQFSGPKTSRANRDRKEKRRKKTPTYLHFSVMLTRAGHIFNTPSAEMNILSPYSISKSSILHCAHHDAGSALQNTTAALNSPICCGPVPPSNTAANRFKSLDVSYQTVSWIRVN